jgi:hypothetical protein
VKGEVSDAGNEGPLLLAVVGFEAWELGGIPVVELPIFAELVIRLLEDDEDEGHDGEPDEQGGDELEDDADEVGGDPAQAILRGDETDSVGDGVDEDDEGKDAAHGQQVEREDRRADEVALREVAGGDDFGAAVGPEDRGELGFGEGAVELFGAVVDLGAEVGAEFVEDVVAGGGGKVLADGLEVTFE